MSDIVEVQPEITGSEAPNQPMADPENASSVETTNQPQEEADRPEWLPEKFQSAEDLADAYKELEGKLGQPKEEETAAESEEGEQEPTKVDGWQTKIEPFTKEYAEKGELTEESFNKLNEMGYPRELVESYMAGQEALGRVGSVQENEILSKVGGQEAYAEMTEWARDNLSEVELQSYNKTMDGGDGGAAELAVMGLQARFQAANSTPNLLTGEAKGGGKGKAIRSNSELIELMSDPRYEKDAAYREDIQKRLGVSDIL